MPTRAEKRAEEARILAAVKKNKQLSVGRQAKILKVSPSRIYHVLTKNGIGRGQFKDLGKNSYRAIALLLYTDKSLSAIGRDLEISRERISGIQSAALFNGIKFKKRGR